MQRFTVELHYCDSCLAAAEGASGPSGRTVGHLVDAAAPDRGWYLAQILGGGYDVNRHGCSGFDCDCALHDEPPQAGERPGILARVFGRGS